MVFEVNAMSWVTHVFGDWAPILAGIAYTAFAVLGTWGWYRRYQTHRNEAQVGDFCVSIKPGGLMFFSGSAAMSYWAMTKAFIDI